MSDLPPQSMPDVLDAWRKTLNLGSLVWREPTRAFVDRRAERRGQKRRERVRRDRKFFGQDTWGVSQRHREATTREEVLAQHGLPLIHSEIELAKWLGISLGRLRYFSHDNPADKVWHYVKYTIPKRSGGQRVILAPKTELKGLQHKILREMLDKITPHRAANGFVKGHSIVTNAQRHVGRAFVLKLDLKDFFPTITYPRVRGLFILWGYSYSVASALALLCTEYDRATFERGGETFWISLNKRSLVQGAPTSPALANMALWGLDLSLQRLAYRHFAAYTRYADDLTFSADRLGTLLSLSALAQEKIAKEGFIVNDKKTRIMRSAGRQVVTGLVVNQKVSVPSDLRRRIRAILHNAAKTGLDAQNRDHHPDFRAHLQGMISFIAQANPQEAAQLLAALQNLPA